jgi:uncharacterized membrane protein YphA (DoxX/SURF4 family)
MLPSSRTYASWLALARIYTGFFWLEHGVGKLRAQPPFGAPNGAMAQFLAEQAAKTAGPYHDFLVTVVVPNLPTFAYAIELGELLAGALLLTGLFTRFGALVGVILALNYAAATDAFHGLAASSGFQVCAAVLTALSLVLPTGRFFGLDALGARGRAQAPTGVGPDGRRPGSPPPTVPTAPGPGATV